MQQIAGLLSIVTLIINLVLQRLGLKNTCYFCNTEGEQYAK